ncbi:hypothetical protein T492DRAFT_844514 [Pavlovales sp. CCMP2436]|nr:hypothetical protein T492DRAFT_844514 [Pavlovales sp. CCMP2436]
MRLSASAIAARSTSAPFAASRSPRCRSSCLTPAPPACSHRSSSCPRGGSAEGGDGQWGQSAKEEAGRQALSSSHLLLHRQGGRHAPTRPPKFKPQSARWPATRKRSPLGDGSRQGSNQGRKAATTAHGRLPMADFSTLFNLAVAKKAKAAASVAPAAKPPKPSNPAKPAKPAGEGGAGCSADKKPTSNTNANQPGAANKPKKARPAMNPTEPGQEAMAAGGGRRRCAGRGRQLRQAEQAG